MTRPLRMGAALVGFGVLLSQLGHLVVYELLYGSAAQSLQSTGAHAYFPTLVKTGLGLGAGAVLVSLLVIGAARVAAGGRMRTVATGPSYLSLLGGLFTIQLAFFAVQETVESAAAGTAIATAPQLLLFGAVGQLPVALLAAVALKWLMVRFEAAITEIRIALPSVWKRLSPVAMALSTWSHFDGDLVLKSVARASPAKRGPPLLLRFSSN